MPRGLLSHVRRFGFFAGVFAPIFAILLVPRESEATQRFNMCKWKLQVATPTYATGCTFCCNANTEICWCPSTGTCPGYGQTGIWTTRCCTNDMLNMSNPGVCPTTCTDTCATP